MAVRPIRRVESRAIVLDRDAQDAAVVRRADRRSIAPSRRGETAYLTLFSTSVCSDSRGTRGAAASLGRSIVVAQPVAEPHALDLEVVADDAQLLVERHERRRRARRATTAAATRAAPVIRSAPPGSSWIERGDRVQRVEQEVRLHARLERGELRFGRQPPRLGLVALLGAQRAASWRRAGRACIS